MLELFKRIRSAMERGEDTVLCTIVASSGSAPRGKGAKMAVFADGSTAGTIGGGAVEQISTKLALQVLASRTSVTQPFCLDSGQIQQIGMICGGNVTVHFRFLDAQKDLALIDAILSRMQGSESAWLLMRMEQGAVTQMGLYDALHGLQFMQPIPEALLAENLQRRAVLTTGEPAYYFEPIVQKGTVYVFGGGHVSRELVPLLAHLGFPVVVYDNRRELAKIENFSGAKNVIFGQFDAIFEHINLTPDDYAVIMTPGHQGDFEILTQVLATEARYVGCIGSRKKVARTKQRLTEAGFSQAQIERMVSPIGLPILAETPAEIAVSIAAQLIACRAEGCKGSGAAG